MGQHWIYIGSAFRKYTVVVREVHYSQQSRDTDTMLYQCWASVEDGVPTLIRHWIHVFAGSLTTCFRIRANIIFHNIIYVMTYESFWTKLFDIGIITTVWFSSWFKLLNSHFNDWFSIFLYLLYLQTLIWEIDFCVPLLLDLRPCL